MAHFTAKPILEDLAELDELLFGDAQSHLRSELDFFASHPESSISIGPEELARAYVQLSGCRKRLNSALEKQDQWREVSDTGRETLAKMQDLDQLLQDLKQRQAEKEPPFAAERAEFLAQLNAEREAVDREIQQQKDKIEEYYARKKRESTYRNLVGTDQTWM
ncbi:hypothetical protein BX666DRAFT_2033444 [Dichotomocladium elegans]|nr:hypothetical protein BX666DRAFT_2033444 [Dichotomocladium elegans]